MLVFKQTTETVQVFISMFNRIDLLDKLLPNLSTQIILLIPETATNIWPLLPSHLLLSHTLLPLIEQTSESFFNQL